MALLCAISNMMKATYCTFQIKLRKALHTKHDCVSELIMNCICNLSAVDD